MQLNHFLRRLYLLKPTERGCWEWPVNDRPSGFRYVSVQIDGKRHYVHRLAWEIANGRRAPREMDVCHTCDNPPCCNPEHLWLGTRAENIKDCAAKGRQVHPLTERMAAKTHCIRGHEFNAENAKVDKHGHRVCMVCRRLRWNRDYHAKKSP